MDIYTEALTRTNIGGGPVWTTFTPLLGMSDVVRRFLQEKFSGSALSLAEQGSLLPTAASGPTAASA